MASIYKQGKRWRAQVLIHGQRHGKVFNTKAEALRWALMAEAEGQKAPIVAMLVKDAPDKLHTLFINEGRSDISRAAADGRLVC